MKRIVVLGASIAGVKALEKIKKHVPDCKATIISFDGSYPYNRRRFVQIIGKSEKEEALYYKPKEYYEKNNIDLRLETKITRINLDRKKIYTEDKNHIEYDTLIIADLPGEKYPDIKGTNKNNIFHLNKLGSLRELYDMLPIAESTVIQSDRIEGLLMALACVRHNCDVRIVTSKEQPLPQWLNEEVLQALINSIPDERLSIEVQTQIAEVLGEGDAKAVRLSSNKVLASDATVFADVTGDMKLFDDSSLAVNERIVVDEQFKTNMDDVYALDQACERTGAIEHFPKTIAELEYEGEKTGAAITAEEFSASKPLGEASLDLEGLHIVSLGAFDSEGADEEKTFFDPEGLIYKRLVLKEGRPVAALLINAPDKKELFAGVLKGERALEQIEAEFPEPVMAGAPEEPLSEERVPVAPEQAVEEQQLREQPPESD